MEDKNSLLNNSPEFEPQNYNTLLLRLNELEHELNIQKFLNEQLKTNQAIYISNLHEIYTKNLLQLFEENKKLKKEKTELANNSNLPTPQNTPPQTQPNTPAQAIIISASLSISALFESRAQPNHTTLSNLHK